MSTYSNLCAPATDERSLSDSQVLDGTTDPRYIRTEELTGLPSCNTPASDAHLKNEMIAMVAHELRGPLSPLRLAACAMRLASTGMPDISRLVDIMDRQIAQIARLAEDLTDVTRISHNALRLCVSEVDLVDVLTDPLEAASVAVVGRGQRLTIEVADWTLRIEADPVRLMQALNNILDNAVKYTPTNGHIDVTVRMQGHDLIVSVRDDGAGVASELLPHIFDLFTQSRRTIAASAGGLGIGLAVVKAIVQAHGGTVSAISAGPGHGSEFILRLPVVRQ